MNQAVQLFLRSNRRQVGEMLLSGLLINCFSLAVPLFSSLVYDKAMGNEVHDTLWALAGGMLILFVMEICLRLSRVFIIEHAGARWDAHLDERFMRGILAAPISKALPVGDVLSRYRELAGHRDLLSAQCLLPIADLPFLLVFVTVTAFVGGPLVLVPMGVGCLLVGIGVVLHGVSARRLREGNEANSRKITWLVNVLTAREGLMTQAEGGVAMAGYRVPAMVGSKASAKARLWSQLSQLVVPVGMSLCTVIVLVWGVFRVESQVLSVGGLISTNMLSARILSLMCCLAPMVSKWRDFGHALRELHATVDFNAAPLSAMAAEATALSTEGVRLDGASFRYPEQDRAVLDGLTLHLQPGQLVAVVGASGAGKSTLLKVLAGHVPHTAGRLSFGGHLINSDTQRRWLCSQVSYKPQDPSYLCGTLAQVLAPGQAHPADASLVDALRRAGLGPVIDRGELGLNTQVGTNGAGLSGGQRQMVALAKAFHATQSTVLLDEPTLGLDRGAQERVLSELKVLAQGRCVVVATHAAEVIQLADRVLVLDKGRIVADAPPAKLMGTAAPSSSSSTASPTQPARVQGSAEAAHA